MEPHLSPTRELFELIWETIDTIPPGRVAAYGEVATAAGLPGRARLVGKALSSLPEGSAVPWYRVINSSGRISLPRGGPYELQEALLTDEGIEFVNGRIPSRYRWRPS